MMPPLPKAIARDVLAAKFRSLGMDGEAELKALLGIIRRTGDVRRGHNIVAIEEAPHCAIILLDGIAYWYKEPDGGRRQILAFQYPGDLLDFHRYVMPKLGEAISIRALTDCSVGVAHYDDLARAIEQHPKIGLALWRAAMLTALIWRERMLNTVHAAAIGRVAHLLCEQLFRLEAIGTAARLLPLSQSDVADATGLSLVHVNRVIQQLRRADALSDSKGPIQVLDRDRLAQIGKFDGRYLNMPALLSNWEVSIGNR
jgi:CRP-like cAMP-binding protein